ncbi:hypothetical protein Taro_036894 [Colocasia esculenta]|uniref:Phospholipase/carboxylesterase/thioesterase domain-containing protein n=1 Tax=Colocasia esculenta TaxID=4460 RepID=A0A843WEN6_COLES|nr:hypothetical protein [Colocasia esculenta]
MNWQCPWRRPSYSATGSLLPSSSGPAVAIAAAASLFLLLLLSSSSLFSFPSSHWGREASLLSFNSRGSRGEGGMTTRGFVLWLHGLGDSGPANEPIKAYFTSPEFKTTRWSFPSASHLPVSCNWAVQPP